MPKGRSLNDKLARLRALRGDPTAPAALRELRAALADASNFVVADAAELVGTAHVAELAPELAAAFDHFMVRPLQRDKTCRAKTAIAEALNLLEYTGEEVFWRGARHVQPEPVWGGTQDTAAGLRATCAFALVRNRAHGVMPFLVELLTDSEKPARVGAAQALAYAETEAAGLLLQLKARLGDPDPEVLSECFNGVLKLFPGDGVAFVAEFLDRPDPGVQEGAILALGDSRRREAFPILRTFHDRQPDPRLHEAIFMALALLRLPEAFDYLLDLVAKGTQPEAVAALAALALHRYDPRLRERVAAAVADRPELQSQFDKRFAAAGDS